MPSNVIAHTPRLHPGNCHVSPPALTPVLVLHPPNEACLPDLCGAGVLWTSCVRNFEPGSRGMFDDVS